MGQDEGLTVRAFIAVKVPPTPALEQVAARLGQLGRPVKGVAADNLHVTLKFLGKTERDKLPRIVEILRTVVEPKTAFEMPIIGVGAFPHRGRPSVVWAGLENAETLAEMADELEQELEPLGFAPEKRKFHAHVTLARVKAKPPAELHALFEEHESTDFGRARVESVELFQSELTPEGPRYTVIESVPLSGGAR